MRGGIQTTLSWIPGQAFIAGNKLADQLGKDASQKAPSLQRQYNVITMSDVKSAVKISTKLKWQIRLTRSKTGRQLNELVPVLEERPST